ncbi:MAG: 5-oxoprolinase subunit B family protein [Actinomycetota bacterium]
MNVETRYTWGGDEYLAVQLAEAMSLEANFTATALSSAIEARALPGVTDVCSANASLLIRFDPDLCSPADLEKEVREIEDAVEHSASRTLDTRIVELPVWYDDPYTNEVAMRFRDRHQRPDGNDLEYAAEANGLPDVRAFIDAHQSSPWLTSMVGFVAGLPFLFQMVPQERQLEVPKYVRPRTDTPKGTIGHGGCFGCVYSVRGAGGYQMFGITPALIFEPTQEHPDFEDFMVFFRPGDIVKFRSVSEDEFRDIEAQVEAGTYRLPQHPVRFDLDEYLADSDAYNSRLLEVLRGA